jgi:hypothetical protein
MPPHVRKQLPPAEQVASILKRRAASKLPEEERYRPKWLMALQMLDELAGWGLRPPVLVADAGYGQVAEFRQGLTERDVRYVVATTSATTAQPGNAEPVQAPYAGVGRPAVPKCAGESDSPAAPAAPVIPTAQPTNWPDTSSHCGSARPARQDDPTRPLRRRRRRPTRMLATDPVAARRHRTIRLLAVRPAPRHPADRPRPTRQGPLAHRARLPRTEDRPRPGPLRRPLLQRLAPPRHPRHRRPALPHPPAPHPPKSRWAGPSLYAVLRELQYMIATWLGTCPTCHQLVPT